MKGKTRRCPACPRPGESGPLHLALDGMFRLSKRKKSGKHHKADQYASNYFMPPPGEVKTFLAEHNPDQPIGIPKAKKVKGRRLVTCKSHFRAGDEKRNRSRMKIFSEQGIFGIVCARHGTPLLFVDMYHGERFAYADFALLYHLEQYSESKGNQNSNC